MNAFTDLSTIVSLSSAQGGAIAVIRLSGVNVFDIAQKLYPSKNFYAQKSHTAFLGTIKDADEIVDEVLFTVFHQGKSYTGESTVEISCHGSPFIIRKILSLCIGAGSRLAEAGEFTKRAFLNGKLDLAQAEAVADLIATESVTQHRIAMQQMKGKFSDKLKSLRAEMLDFASLLELEIDFSEEDIEFAHREKLIQFTQSLLRHILKLMESFQKGNAIKEGIHIVIIGQPNVGKSSLFNVLIEEDRAIISELAGTTRDVIEDTMQMEGVLFRFMDTAGLRETDDKIEHMGIEKTKEKIQKAHTLLVLSETEQLDETTQHIVSSLSEHQHQIFVLTKNDIHHHNPKDEKFISISIKNNEGIETLKQKMVAPYIQIANDEVLVNNTRHYACLAEAQKELNILLDALLNKSKSADMLAWHLRQALYSLGQITGDIHTEDVLGNIFSRFCIGK